MLHFPPPTSITDIHSSYVDRQSAADLNLTFASASSAVLRVDTAETNSSTGRRSVRVESKRQYNQGLFIFHVIHTPYQCSVEPALWLTNKWNWPADGEIDVMGAANMAMTGNQVTLHTSEKCSMRAITRYQTGNIDGEYCFNGTQNNRGCGVRGSPSTFGPEFNQNGGGVYALEIRKAGIRVWHFSREAVPPELAKLVFGHGVFSRVDTTQWGLPLADFPSTECLIEKHFRNQSIIANIDLCGPLAGSHKHYSVENHCPGNCVEYVAEQPGSVYQEAYWEFGGMWVLQAV